MTPKQKECLAMMERVPFVELTTVDADGFPSTRAMLNLRNTRQYPHLAALYAVEENPPTVYMTTNTSSEKIAEIVRNPRACLYFCEPGAFRGMMLRGTVEHVTDAAFRAKVWQKGWEIYYPAGDSDYSALRFTPDKLKTYSDFQTISEKI